MNEIENKHTQPKNSEIGYNGFYLERSGQQAHEIVDELLRPPEHPLSEEQKQEVYAHEASLADFEITPGLTIELTIRGAKEEDTTAPLFFAHPFIEGKIDLSAYGSPTFTNDLEVYRWIANAIKEKSIPPAELRTIGQNSLKTYKGEVSKQLLQGTVVDEAMTRAHSFVVDPESFLKSAEDANLARSVLKDKRHEFFQAESDIENAKRATVNIYLARINEIVARHVPMSDYLVEQSLISGDHDMMNRAIGTIPAGMRQALLDHRTHKEMLKRLDYLRNGIAVNSDGASAVADAAMGMEYKPEPLESANFSPEQVAVLQTTMLQPEVMRDIMMRILDRAGMLSSEDSSTWSVDRKYRAADGKYQVVINPGKATFAIDGISGVSKVAAEERSIYDFLVVNGFHETKHIDQSEADRELAKVIRIGQLKGKRVSMIREAGANAAQRVAEKQFFGTMSPISSTYAHAMKKIEMGAGIGEAATAFFNETKRIDPKKPLGKAASDAADRVVRLVRQGGFSSQPMVYAEEAILADELQNATDQERRRVTLITGLDLVDQLKLHKYGLLPDIQPLEVDWAAIVVQELRPYIDAALRKGA